MLKRNVNSVPSARAKVRIAEARLRAAKRALKEAEEFDTDLVKFFRFEDALDEPAIMDWMEEIIEDNGMDACRGVWFEDETGEAEAAGIPVKTMPQIVRSEPRAVFGFAHGYGNELERYSAREYIRNVGDSYGDFKNFGM